MSTNLAFAAAAYDLALAVFHLMFWRLFGWPESLRPSGHVNVAITQTLNLMLTYCFVVLALGLAWAATADASVVAGLAAAGAGFWAIRALLQPVLFGARRSVNLWFVGIFVLGAGLHAAAAFVAGG
jgi:hypothetical protein